MMTRFSLGSNLVPSVRLWICLAVVLLLHTISSRGGLGQDVLQIDAVNLYGLTTNATTKLDIRGKGFDDSLRLTFPFEVEQKLTLISASQAQLEVRLGNIPPQIAWGAFQTEAQVAGLRRWAIDPIANEAFSEKVEVLPTSVHGTLSGNQVQRIAVELREGDYFFVDVQARRLGATFQPLLRVLDEKNRQLASGGPSFSIDGDTYCRVRIPKTGTYTVTLQDLTFAAPSGPFRLRLARTDDEKLWNSARVEGVQLEPLGQWFSLGAFPDGQSHAPIDFGFQTTLTRSENLLPRSLRTSWTRYSMETLVAEDVPNVGKVFRIPSLPAIVSGTIRGRESARFVVSCGAGKPLEAEVWATRLGADFDPQVVIRHLDQRPLSQGDDRPGTIDPSARFGGDASISEVHVTIESVIPIAADKREGFELVLSQPMFDAIGIDLTTPQLLVHRGSGGVLEVNLNRNGIQQPIEMAAVGYNESISGQHEPKWVLIPANQQRGLIPVQLAKESAASQWFTVIARYAQGDGGRVIQATLPGRNVITTGAAEQIIPVVQTPAVVETNVTWQANLPDPLEFVGGLVYELPLAWSWPELTEDQKKLKLKGELITTQNIPRTNPQDGNSPLDYRRALQLGTMVPGQPAVVIAASGDPKNPSSPATSTLPLGGESMLRLVVPADAPEDHFQWSVKWSLLAEDGKTLGVPWVPQPISGRIVAPMAIRLEKELPSPWNWSKDEAENIVQVIVESRPGVSGTAQIVWQGLPQGITPPSQDVMLGAEVTKVAVRLPDLKQQAAGTKLEGLKLVIQWNPNFEGSGVFTSPAIALPAIHFP